MNRRDALTRVSLLLGGTILGAEAFLSGCTNPPEQKLNQVDAKRNARLRGST